MVAVILRRNIHATMRTLALLFTLVYHIYCTPYIQNWVMKKHAIIHVFDQECNFEIEFKIWKRNPQQKIRLTPTRFIPSRDHKLLRPQLFIQSYEEGCESSCRAVRRHTTVEPLLTHTSDNPYL
jgi:hypothetical protein